MGGRTAVAIAGVLWLGLGLAPPLAGVALARWLIAATACTLLSLRAPPRTSLALALMAVACAAVARGGAARARADAGAAWIGGAGVVARLTVVVEEPPRREGGEPVAAVRVIEAAPALARDTRLRLRWPASSAGEWADTLDVLARIDAPSGPRLPGGFDARGAMRAQGVTASARALSARVRVARGPASLPVAAAMRLRRACERALVRGLPGASRELAAPLLFGDRSAMSTETDAALRASGLVHLLALSGLHVAWMAAVARGLAAIGGASARSRALAGAACAVGYALLAGPIPSLWRASATELVTALAQRTERALDPVQALAVSAVALLTWSPGWAADLGFQLSCAATLGLVTLSGPLAAPLRARRVPALLVTPVAATLAAQAAALPLLIARFHAVPWTGLAANLVAVPIAELLLAGAWLGALAEVLLPGAGAIWFSACTPLAASLAHVSRSAASIPLALLPCGEGTWAAGAAAAGALLLMSSLPPPRRAVPARPARGRASARWAGVAALTLALLSVLTEPERRPPAGVWWLVALDVGQGDALAIGTREGWWLVDTGARSPRWDAGEGVVLPFLRWACVRRLEGLVLTHDDSDHTGGAAATRRGVLVRRVFAPVPLPGVPGPAERFGATPAARGDTLRRGEPAIVVLWPPREGEAGEALARRGDNAASLVLRVGDARHPALLLADVDSLGEAELPLAAVSLLKAGHHGSASSTGAALLRRTAPSRAVLSCGRRNRYGHPDARVLARLASAGVPWDRTDLAGTLAYAIDERGVRPLDWRGGELAGRGRALSALGPCASARAH